MARSIYQAARTMREVGGARSKTGQLLRGLTEQSGKQKKAMTDEFNREMATAERKMQEALRKKAKKKKWYEKLAPALLGLIGGPVGIALGGLVGGGQAIKGIKDQQKHARGQIAKARQYGLDPRYAGTFLSQGAQQFGSQKRSMLDDLYAKTDVDSSKLLTAGLMGGLQGAMGAKMVGGFKSGFAAPTAATDSITTETIASGAPGAIGDISAGVLPGKITGLTELVAQDPTFLQKLMGGFKGATGGMTDFQKLFSVGDDGKGGEMASLMALLAPLMQED
tara:strand:+ start:11134 stop:11970 length:837 start_codon:yes stop_codon:yes gene_type:complete